MKKEVIHCLIHNEKINVDKMREVCGSFKCLVDCVTSRGSL